jgi:hypothetical protein
VAPLGEVRPAIPRFATRPQTVFANWIATLAVSDDHRNNDVGILDKRSLTVRCTGPDFEPLVNS